MHVALLQKIASHRLPGPTLEQHVVRHDDGTAAIDLEQRLDVLHEVELLVLGRGPKVLPFVGRVVFLQIAQLIDDGDAAFLTERRIGQDHAEPFTGIAGETVHTGLDRAGISINPVEIQVHNAEPGRVGNQLPALHELRPQMLLLVLVERLALMLDDVIVSGQKEATRTCCWIANGVVGSELYAVHDGLDEFTGREVLARPFWTFGGTLGEQPFVDIPLHISIHLGQFLHVDEVHDQPPQRGRVLDFRPSLLEDFAQHPRLLA